METTAIRTDAIYGRPEYSPYTAPVLPPQPLPIAMLPPQRPMGPVSPQTGVSSSPGLAFLLGWIPGVGAIYNGQYAKGLVHVVVFGLLVSLINHAPGDLEPLFGMSIAAWFFYMAFEAYHTAKKRLLGIPVDEFSSLVHLDTSSGRIPLAPVLLICLGAFFLLANFELISIQQILRFWPLGLIGVGLYLLMGRMNAGRRP
jgi:TM2 domain-containing membrane protein YozV